MEIFQYVKLSMETLTVLWNESQMVLERALDVVWIPDGCLLFFSPRLWWTTVSVCCRHGPSHIGASTSYHIHGFNKTEYFVFKCFKSNFRNRFASIKLSLIKEHILFVASVCQANQWWRLEHLRVSWIKLRLTCFTTQAYTVMYVYVHVQIRYKIAYFLLCTTQCIVTLTWFWPAIQSGHFAITNLHGSITNISII